MTDRLTHDTSHPATVPDGDLTTPPLDEDELPTDPQEDAEPEIQPDEQRPVLLPDESDYPPAG